MTSLKKLSQRDTRSPVQANPETFAYLSIKYKSLAETVETLGQSLFAIEKASSQTFKGKSAIAFVDLCDESISNIKYVPPAASTVAKIFSDHHTQLLDLHTAAENLMPEIKLCISEEQTITRRYETAKTNAHTPPEELYSLQSQLENAKTNLARAELRYNDLTDQENSLNQKTANALSSIYLGELQDDAWYEDLTNAVLNLVEDIAELSETALDIATEIFEITQDALAVAIDQAIEAGLWVYDQTTGLLIWVADATMDAGYWLAYNAIRGTILEFRLYAQLLKLTVGEIAGEEVWNQAINNMVKGAHFALPYVKMATLGPGGASALFGQPRNPHGIVIDSQRTYTDRPILNFGGSTASDSSDRGRQTVSYMMAETASEYQQHQNADQQIREDEFEIVQHDETTYTVVLGGVTDLSGPTKWLDPYTDTPRDLDLHALLSSIDETKHNNGYALMVEEAMKRQGIPKGADVMIVGHSYGADTALDLASDSEFNGGYVNVTHAVAAGYNTSAQLEHVENQTQVLSIQNNADLVVQAEKLLDDLTFDSPNAGDHNAINRNFNGGISGFGHSQNHYIDYLERANDSDIDAFYSSIDRSGYSQAGESKAVNISIGRIVQ